MAWSGSAMFAAYVAALLRPDEIMRGSWTNSAARHRVALFGAGVSPDPGAPPAETSYGTGTWQTAAELADDPGWPAGGLLMGCTLAAASYAKYLGLRQGAPLTAGPLTVAAVAGVLLYDQVAAAGMGFCDFGGLVNVGGGDLTLAWPTSAPYVLCLVE